MNLRQSIRHFLNTHELKGPRQIKWWLEKQFRRIRHWGYIVLDKILVARNRRRIPEIISKEDTLNRIIRDRCSIARLGDGELGLIFGKGIGFQPYDQALARRMCQILQADDDPNMLVGISEWIFYSDYGQYPEYRVQNLRRILDLLVPGKAYCSADISRFYKSTPDGREALNQIRLLRQIWDGRNVTLIEGAKSRMGVGNDLLDNAKRLRRILCPAVNAFSHYQEICRTALELIPKDELVLIALGPTATVLAYDLHQAGYQAVDIGHADISYEWFLRDVKDPSGRVAITGKYVNEVAYGNEVEDVQDADYTSQIIARIGIGQD
jgi:glycosyltransferase family protein